MTSFFINYSIFEKFVGTKQVVKYNSRDRANQYHKTTLHWKNISSRCELQIKVRFDYNPEVMSVISPLKIYVVTPH